MVLGSMGLQELRKLDVACAFALVLAKERHCRGIEAPAAVGTIEALHAEGVEFQPLSLRKNVAPQQQKRLPSVADRKRFDGRRVAGGCRSGFAILRIGYA